MKQKSPFVLLLITVLFSSYGLYAQDSTHACKVATKDLDGTYVGECKNGLAQGKGEARGNHRYVGNFKNGLPHGEGIYYYTDNQYHKGKFQEGVKEGKGEMHYLRNGQPDSVIKGYWSGDEYRGKSYITYNFIGGGPQMAKEIDPISDDGNTVEVLLNQQGGSGSRYYSLSEIISMDGSIIRNLPGGRRGTLTYAIEKFPVALQIMLSDGSSVKLELYKKARWSIRLLVVQ